MSICLNWIGKDDEGVKMKKEELRAIAEAALFLVFFIIFYKNFPRIFLPFIALFPVPFLIFCIVVLKVLPVLCGLALIVLLIRYFLLKRGRAK